MDTLSAIDTGRNVIKGRQRRVNKGRNPLLLISRSFSRHPHSSARQRPLSRMPTFNPLLSTVRSSPVFRLFAIRPSRLPVLAVVVFVFWTCLRYAAGPEADEEQGGEWGLRDYVPGLGGKGAAARQDAHLYDFHKYPVNAGGARHHRAADGGAASFWDDGDDEDVNLGGSGGSGFRPINRAASAHPHGHTGSLEYEPKDGLVRGWEYAVSSSVAKRANNKKGGKKGAVMSAEETTELILREGKRSEHPIEHLMRVNKERWQGLLRRQSKTLEDAVREYRRRYGRLPPRGFDRWWAYCQEHDVKIVDDYDQIEHDVEPFFALSPQVFRDRVEALETADFTYHLQVGPNVETRRSGLRADATRAKQFESLVGPLREWIPQDLQLHVSDHDLGSWIVGADQRELAIQRIHAALKDDGTGLNAVKHLSATELKRLENKNRHEMQGWFSACPDDSPARGKDRAMENRLRELEGLPPLPPPAQPAFVKDVRPGMDWCNVPEVKKLHGTMSFDVTKDTTLRPIFVLSKHQRNNEFLFPAMEAYENSTSKDALKKHLPWSAKTINKLFWRGSSTGDSYSRRKSNPDYDWRKTHRPRLHLMMQAEEGDAEIWLKRGREWAPETWSVKKLNAEYMDVGLMGKPHQCNQADGTCDEMASEIKFKDKVMPEQAAAYKCETSSQFRGDDLPLTILRAQTSWTSTVMAGARASIACSCPARSYSRAVSSPSGCRIGLRHGCTMW